MLRSKIEDKQTKADQLDSKVAKVSEQIETHEKAIRLAQICIEKQADIRSYVCGMANAFGKGFPTNRLDLAPKQDEAGVITGLTPIIYEDDVPCDPKEHGGGINNTYSLAIRVAEIVYHWKRYGTEPLLVLDEQGLNLDSERAQGLVEALEGLVAQGVPIQVFSVGHQGGLHFDENVMVVSSGKISKVRRQWHIERNRGN